MMDTNTTVVFLGFSVAAVAGILGLSLTALRNAKASLRGRRIATFVMLVSIAVTLLFVALNRT